MLFSLFLWVPQLMKHYAIVKLKNFKMFFANFNVFFSGSCCSLQIPYVHQFFLVKYISHRSLFEVPTCTKSYIQNKWKISVWWSTVAHFLNFYYVHNRDVPLHISVFKIIKLELRKSRCVRCTPFTYTGTYRYLLGNDDMALLSVKSIYIEDIWSTELPTS